MSTQTLKRFIGSRNPSPKELAWKMLALLEKDEGDYSAYFTDQGRRRRLSNNREVIRALILKIEELEQKIDNLVNMVNFSHRWDGQRARWK